MNKTEFKKGTKHLFAPLLSEGVNKPDTQVDTGQFIRKRSMSSKE